MLRCVMTIAEQIIEKLRRAPEAVAREVLAYLERLEGERTAQRASPKLSDFIGVLKGSPSLNGSPADAQRALRDEWA